MCGFCRLDFIHLCHKTRLTFIRKSHNSANHTVKFFARLVSAFPLLRNALQQLLHSLGLLLVDSLLELVSLQTADILNICCECCATFAANAEFYCHLFCIKIYLVLCLFT